MLTAGIPGPNCMMSFGYPGCNTVSLKTQNCLPAIIGNGGGEKIHEKRDEKEEEEEGKDTCGRSDYLRGATQESL